MMTTTPAEDAWSLAFGSLSLDDGMALREGAAWRLLPGNAPDRYAHLVSIADLDAFLRTDAARAPRVSMADGSRRGSAAVPQDNYLEPGSDRVDLPALLACHDAGASLVVSQFHEIHPPLARFCRGLEKAFLHGVQANIYLTPPGAQGFCPAVCTGLIPAAVQTGNRPTLSQWYRAIPIFCRLPLRGLV